MWRFLFSLLVVASVTTVADAQAVRYETLANSPFVENRPTAETAKLLKDELLFQRAPNRTSNRQELETGRHRKNSVIGILART
jgi:hypothetical protein